MIPRSRSVLQEWIFGLPYRMQSILMSAIRGCDGAGKDDPSKWIARSLRGLILNNADTSNSFIASDQWPDDAIVQKYLWDIDGYPMHYVCHLMHAAEIVGFKHPEEKVREVWIGFYRKCVKGLHCNPESVAQLDVRLGQTPEETAFKTALDEEDLATSLKVAEEEMRRKLANPPPVPEHKWDAGTGTSHGNRQRSYSGSS